MYKWGLDLYYETITGKEVWHWLPIFRTKEVCLSFYESVISPILEANSVLTIEYACRVIN